MTDAEAKTDDTASGSKPTDKSATLERWEKITSLIQNVCVSLAAIFGSYWALSQFYVEGKNVSGPDVSITARQIGSADEKYLIAADVTITGSDRRGYHYDFRESFLSVAKVSIEAHPEIDLEAIGRIPPTIVLVMEDGQIGGAQIMQAHISSYRKTGYSFLVPVPEPGTYLLTFAMPSSGVVDGNTGDLPKVDPNEKNVLGVFGGETKSVYVTVKPEAPAG